MKKLISLVLVLILVCTLAVTASATKIDISKGTSIIAPGETVVVMITLEETIPADQGATVLQGVLSYNGDALELQKVTKVSKDLTNAAKHKSEDKVIFHYLSMDSTAKAFAGGQLVEVTFKAKEEISGDHAAAGLNFVAAVQNAQGENVGNVEFPEAVSLVVATAHTWDDGTVTKKPTCVAEGEKTYKCTFDGCEATKIEKVEVTGIHQWQDADCDSPKTCETCGTTDGAALGHDWEPATSIKAKTCKVCGVVSGKPLGLNKPTVTASTDATTGTPVLSWGAVENADTYKIYRATSKNGKYSKIGSVYELTYADVTAKTGKTYYYKVIAAYTADENANSGYSTVVSAKAKLARPEITVYAGVTSGKPVVKWAKISGAKKYTVYRATSETGKYTAVKTTTSASYTDTKATVGKTYYYKVKAIASSTSYNSGYSENKSCLTICGQPALTISISSTTGKPSLSWKKITGAVSYDIYRADAADGEFTKLANQTALSYADASVAPDTDYWYKVNAIGASEELNSADGTAKKTHSTLAKPVVTFKVDSVTGKPMMTWSAVEGAVEYKVYRSSYSTKSYKVVATVTDTNYTDTTVSVGKGYYYKVIAVGENGNSAYSAYKKLTAKCAQPIITVEASASSGKPVVKWAKISGAKKYTVYRATSETGKYTAVKTTTSASYTDTKATVGKTYYYKVKALATKTSYNSGYSEIKSCLTFCAQPALTVTVSSITGKPILSWKKITGAASYDIYRAEAEDGEFKKLANQTAVTYQDETTVPDKDYWYKVNAIGASEEMNSAEGAAKKIHTTCAKPVIKGTMDTVTGKPIITWEEVDGAVSYEIVRSTKKNGTYKVVGTDDDGSFVDSTAVKGKTYYYKVIAVCASSRSTPSSYMKIKSK